jgi:ATP-dependent Clp protease ATP-binding subunit ClpA
VPYLSDRFHDQNANGTVDAAPTNLNRTGTFDAAAAAAGIRRRVLGQSDALAAVEHALLIAQAGFHDRERPLASLLLVGPTGVGKTELVRRLAAALRGGPDDLCRVDMGQLGQEHYAASLAGAPPGYAGSRESSSLFDRGKIEGTSLTPGIVLFDEVEKAHPVVLRALLGVLDHGQLTLANGEQTISFRNCFVFLTSNLGSAEVARRRSAGWRWAMDSAHRLPGLGDATSRAARLLGRRDAGAVQREVHRFFEPEFLNRLDEVVYFNEISPDTAADIVRLRLEEVTSLLGRRGVELHVGTGVVDTLVDRGFDPVTGARGLSRAIRRHLLVPVAEALVAHRSTGANELQVRIDAATSDGPAPLTVRPHQPGHEMRP